MDGILFPYLTLERTKRFSVVSIDPAYVRLTSLPVCDRYLVHLDLNCDYTSAVVRGALQRRQLWCKQTDDLLIDNLNSNEEADNAYPKAILQIADFENLRWEMVMRAGGKHRASSYLVRKGLSRKAQLSLQLRRYMSKHSNSILRLAVPYTLVIDTWGAFEEMRLDFGGGTFANFDMNTLQAPLRERLKWCLEDVREAVQAPERSTWRWILKPSVTNKGADISLCADWDSVINALEDKPDIREWVLQRYIERPLLVGGHKFHLRVYVLAVGALRVFVFDQILMLLAAHRYEDSDLDDLYKHLTNTARSAEDVNFKEELFVRVLDDLPWHMQHDYPQLLKLSTSSSCDIDSSVLFPAQLLPHVRGQVHTITAELFAAFENEYTVFAPMPNCFELFGLDFIVDEGLQVHLLEVNPGPDFKQTGGRLQGLIADLWEGTLRIVLDDGDGRLGEAAALANDRHPMGSGFTKVYDKEASVNRLGGGMTFTK